jgi:hypothetical protein
MKRLLREHGLKATAVKGGRHWWPSSGGDHLSARASVSGVQPVKGRNRQDHNLPQGTAGTFAKGQIYFVKNVITGETMKMSPFHGIGVSTL